jgi:hypothetical protein
VATGAAWLKGRNSQEERKKNILTRNEKRKKNILDSYRPSHGRSWEGVGVAWDAER